MNFRTLRVLVALVGTLAAATAALGFKQGGSLRPDRPSDKNHQLITAQGMSHSRALLPNFEAVGFSLVAIEDIQTWNAYTDSIAAWNNDAHFIDSEYHFDGDSFFTSIALLKGGRAAIISDVARGRVANARKVLGQALHTIQDFYAHSNWVERRRADSSVPHPNWGSKEPFGDYQFLTERATQTSITCNYDGLINSSPLTTGYYSEWMSAPDPVDKGAFTNGWRDAFTSLDWPADHCVHGGDGDTHGINKDYDARPGFEEAKAAAKEATTLFVSGLLNEIVSQISTSTDPQPLANNLCEFLGRDKSICSVTRGLEEVGSIETAASEMFADRWFRVAIYGRNLSRLLDVKIAGGTCEAPVDGWVESFVVRCHVDNPGSYQIRVEDRFRAQVLASKDIEIGPKDGGSPTLFARMGSAALVWLQDLYSKVMTAVWTVPTVVEKYAVAVADGVSKAFSAVFYSPGEVVADVTLKADLGLNDDNIKTKIQVVYIGKVTPFSVLAGDTVILQVQGENLPPGLTFNFPACATVAEVTENTSTSVRRFRCAVSSKAEAGITTGSVASPGPTTSPFSVLLHEFNIDVVKPLVASVSAAPSPATGGTSVVTVTGANLPKTANALVDEATCDLGTMVAKSDGTGFSQSCTFGPTAGTKLVKVMSASDASSFVIDDTNTLTVSGSPGPTTALFDDFSGTAIDATKWNIDGWEGTGNDYTRGLGRGIGPVTINNGFVEFGRLGRISTKNKVTFSGDNTIVIEGRTASTGALHDTSVMLVDTTSGDQFLMGDTNYGGWGFYAIGIGSYKLKEPSTIGDPTDPLTLGSSTTEFMEYRLTITGDKIKIERGPTLANITQTGTGTLGRSIVGRTFHVSIGAAWAYYPATWDWIRVKADPGPPSAGLVGHWSFDNCDGRDSGPNALNGSVTGAPVCVDGRKGKALRFNGASDWITVPTSAAMPSTAVTMAYWLHREGLAPRTPLENYISKEVSFQAYLYPNSTTQFGVWLGSPGFWTGWGGTATALPTLNDWLHYAFTYDNATKRANTYVNGALVHSVLETNANAVVRVSNHPMFIGRNGSANVYHIKGLLDDVRIYNRALTAAEVQLLAGTGNAMPTSACSSPVADVIFREDFAEALSPSKWAVDLGGGSITAGGGVGAFKSNTTRFPYAQTVADVIPATGNVSVFCRGRYTAIAGSGTGICAATEKLLAPGGATNNYRAGVSYGRWGDAGGDRMGLNWLPVSADSVGSGLPNPAGTSDTEYCFVNGLVQAYRDGVLVGAIAEPAGTRPKKLWIGNPVNGTAPWSSFEALRVEVRRLQ